MSSWLHFETYGNFLPPLTCHGTTATIHGFDYPAEVRAHDGFWSVYITAKNLDKGQPRPEIRAGVTIHLPHYGFSAPVKMVQGYPLGQSKREWYGLSFPSSTMVPSK